jgi:CheY-like chemotaxis protein
MSSVAVPRLKKQIILAVDDEPDFAGIVQQNLEKEGFEVEVAYGLEKVKAHAPDAIVLDVMMPGKDGYQKGLVYNGCLACKIIEARRLMGMRAPFFAKASVW